MGFPGASNLFLLDGSRGYEIEQSLRFNSADSTYLNRTPASAGNRKTYTLSAWVKICVFGNSLRIFEAGTSSSTDRTILYFSSDKFQFFTETGNVVKGDLSTNAVFRDPSAWYHVVWAVDTANTSVKIYVNGVEQTLTTTTAVANENTYVNATNVHYISRSLTTTFGYLDGYLAEVNFIDGSALAPTDFGELDDNGVWRPIKYAGSYTGNSFYLKFASGDGTDDSGLSNTWTANNFTTSGTGTDVMSDTPTTNWCTWNPLKTGTNLTPEDGNLFARMQSSGSGINQSTTATIYVSSGKWYWEGTSYNTLSGYGQQIGIASESFTALNSFTGSTDQTYGYEKSALKHNGATSSSYGASYTTNDVIGVALDLDAGTLVFYKNGVSQGTAFTGISGTFAPYCGLTYSGGGPGFYTNFGQRAFEYTPPTGFKALNTSNLPAPDIADGSDYFNTILWAGNNDNPRTLTGVGFQPDWVWLKDRTQSTNHRLVDAVRGAGNTLKSNNTSSETSSETAGTITAFTSDGFTVEGTSTVEGVNLSGDNYVAWNWLAGNGTSSNTDGSITSTVSANPSAGFSIVTWDGVGAGANTIGHGCGVAPKMIITKQRNASTYNWNTYHYGIDATAPEDYYVALNQTAARGSYTSANAWNRTQPTDTVFSVNSVATAGAVGVTMLAYCFAEVEGYSKFGSYTGNGSSDGPFLSLGFKPAWIMYKITNTTGNWIIHDTTRSEYNVTTNRLFANLTNTENTSTTVSWDLLSNGAKIRTSDAGVNGSGNTFIYAAFAENPFGGSGVSPATAR